MSINIVSARNSSNSCYVNDNETAFLLAVERDFIALLR